MTRIHAIGQPFDYNLRKAYQNRLSLRQITSCVVANLSLCAHHARLGMIARAHDKYFKAVFGKVQNAADLIRTTLPADAVKYFDCNAMTPVRGSSVDSKLTERLADLLFRVPLNSRAPQSFRSKACYVLLEHKSGPKALTAHQSSRYINDVCSDYLKDHAQANRVPWVIPILVHHGRDGWTKPLRLEDERDELPDDAARALGPYQPQMSLVLYDAALESHEALLQAVYSRGQRDASR